MIGTGRIVLQIISISIWTLSPVLSVHVFENQQPRGIVRERKPGNDVPDYLRDVGTAVSVFPAGFWDLAFRNPNVAFGNAAPESVSLRPSSQNTELKWQRCRLANSTASCVLPVPSRPRRMCIF